MTAQIQAMLDRVVGPGNSTVTVTPTLDFDKSVTESKTYNASEGVPPLSESRTSETYTGPAGSGVGGVVGPDGQMEPAAGGADGASSYEKEAEVLDNPVGTVVERRETAPGSIEKLGIGVVLDATTTAAVDPAQIQQLVASATGVDTARGDQITVTSLPFDRTAEEAAQAEIDAAAEAAAAAGRMDLYRNAGLAGLVLLLLLLAWLRGRKKAKQRAEATNLVVEQLRADAAARAATQQAELASSPALAALEQADHDAAEELRDELSALVEKQPEDVAALLRGWLVDR
jgi:flagellar M-ring protein FliF